MSRERTTDRHTLKLGEAGALTPPVDPVEAMRRQLSMALFDAVTPGDIAALAGKLKEQAMAGDTRAAKLFFDLMLGKEKTGPAPGSAGNSNQVAEALRDLVDEIRVARARSGEPRISGELANLRDDDDDEEPAPRRNGHAKAR